MDKSRMITYSRMDGAFRLKAVGRDDAKSKTRHVGGFVLFVGRLLLAAADQSETR